MMKPLYGIWFLASLACTNGEAQFLIPRDTSFTLRATYQKETKKRPYISIADPALPAGILQENDITYRRTGNRALLLDIFYPRVHNNDLPAVLLIFGGGWRSGDKSQNHAIARELTRHGYVAVSAEYRLSPEAPYPAAVYDLKAALRWMRRHAASYGIDSNRIAVLGCSAGGQLAALIGTTNNHPGFEDTSGHPGHSSAVQAVVNIDGILAFHHPESAESTAAALWLGGKRDEAPENWSQASALTHAGAQTAPFLFLNSSQPRFHAGRDDMIQKMKENGIYSEVHEFPDSPHPFWFFHPWFEPMMNYCINFLDKILKP